MSIYLHFDSDTREILGFYPDFEVEDVPKPNVSITDALAQTIQQSGVKWIIGEDLNPQRALIVVSVAEQKSRKLIAINRSYTAAIALAKSPYPQEEIDGWYKQLDEAEKFAVASVPADSDYPVLGGLALHNGTTLADMAQRVLGKAREFAVLYGELTGRRQAMQSALDAIDDNHANAAQQIAAINETDLTTIAQQLLAAS